MKYYSILFITLFLFSCKEQPKEIKASNQVNIAEISFAQTQVALVGNARDQATQWEEYTAFVTAMDNYDHSPDATHRLATMVVNMINELPDYFDNQYIRSRLLVLETRIKSYASFLEYSNREEEQFKKKFKAIITALDSFTGQLNEKGIIEQMQKELLEELKSDLNDLESTPTDSITL